MSNWEDDHVNKWNFSHVLNSISNLFCHCSCVSPVIFWLTAFQGIDCGCQMYVLFVINRVQIIRTLKLFCNQNETLKNSAVFYYLSKVNCIFSSKVLSKLSNRKPHLSNGQVTMKNFSSSYAWPNITPPILSSVTTRMWLECAKFLRSLLKWRQLRKHIVPLLTLIYIQFLLVFRQAPKSSLALYITLLNTAYMIHFQTWTF